MKKLFCILLSVFTILTAAGCSAAGHNQAGSSTMAINAKMAPMVTETAVEMDYAMGEESGIYMKGATQTPQVQDTSRKLIKSVYLELETKALENLFMAVSDKVMAMGGYVQDSSISNPSGEKDYYVRKSASIAARIPSDRLDEFVEAVEGEANVTYRSDNVQDITLNYRDTESHRNSLKVEQDRLNELMKKAETVEDLIAIEGRLSEVRYQLESYESQLRSMDNKVDYSTVTISITEVETYTPQETKSLKERIINKSRIVLAELKIFGENFIVNFIAYLPVIIAAVILIIIISAVVRSGRKKKARKKKIEKTAEQREEEKKPEENRAGEVQQ